MSKLSSTWPGRTGAILGLSVVIALGSMGFGFAAVAQDQPCWTSQPSMELGYPQWPEAPQMVIDQAKTYIATIETNRGPIVIELADDEGPLAVNSFVCLARAGYYDFTLFHRVMNGFMIQGGDPTGTGTGGPGYQFEDELPSDEAPYARGTLAMANAGPNTNGSQFFIVHQDQPAQFPANYAIFGRVTEGLEVLDALVTVPVIDQRGELSDPIPTVGIQSITIEEDGQPMGNLEGGDSAATLASPTAGSTPAVDQAATSAAALTQEPEPVAEGDDDGANVLWIAGSLGIVGLAVLAFGLYRRSHVAGSMD